MKDNIEAVFAKFINEGKFTIRIKEPHIDLCVKADPVLAKGFYQTCKCITVEIECVEVCKEKWYNYNLYFSS